jgi:NAD(P)-dependent dehydrogenase (short-subunit alcohol dehydrogenase family)
MFELDGRLALVTGAGQGVGAGVARTLARQGAAVVVNDLVPARAEEVAAAIVADGGDAIAVAFDVTEPAAVGSGIDSARAHYGRSVDVLVNNAGVPPGMRPVKFHDMTPADWRPYVDLNLYGSLTCIGAVLEDMVANRWGRVVQISSGAGRTGLSLGVALYGASKSGIEGFVRHLSQEVAADGVTVNALALGLMSNVGAAADPRTARMAAAVPVGRLGTPEDIGAAVVYLASDEAAWVTGQTFDINGGQTTH